MRLFIILEAKIVFIMIWGLRGVGWFIGFGRGILRWENGKGVDGEDMEDGWLVDDGWMNYFCYGFGGWGWFFDGI